MKNENRQLNILYVQRDDGGCGFYRCQQPSAFLNRAGYAKSISVLKNPTEEQLLNADLVVMQEMGTIEASNIVKFMEQHRIPFMVEFDDFIQHISPHNMGGYIAWNPSTLFVYRAMEIAKRAAGMTVSTNQLAREYFPYNHNIFVVPNYLDKDRWDVPVSKKQDGKIRIGWCGGNAHADDLYMVSKVIERIVKEYDGKVVFETMGMTKQELAHVFPMEATSTDSCPSCGFEGTLHHFPGEAYESFPNVLGSRGWDIAIAPVINNAFGNCKSDLKVKEYAALGYPTIASDVQPYREAKKAGAPIILADTYEEWYTALKSLIDDEAKRQEMAHAGREWAQGNWIQDRIGEIFDAYRQVVDRWISTFGDKETRLKSLGVVK